MLDPGTEAILQYQLLTTIAFHSIDYRSDGSIDTSAADPGYAAFTGATATTIIEHAHAAGVRIEISVSFPQDPDANHLFFTDAAAQATAVSQTVQLMRLRGADGVNLDVERLYGSDFGAYGAFVAAMRTAVVAWKDRKSVV